MTPGRPESLQVGLLGGTFDPPHRGHLGMGTLARDRLGLHSVLYMPAPVPPHKTGTIARWEDRFEMTRRLIAGHERLEVSDFEQNLPPPHYTVRTLTALLEGPLAGARISLIFGADSLTELHTWRDYLHLFDLARLVAVSRLGYSLANPRLPPELVARVVQLTELAEPVSSTDLRRRLTSGEPTPEIPPAVLEYVREKGLYR